MRVDKNGNGYISIVRLTDIQDKPKLFSTYMLSLLAEIYGQMPEKGDADKPEFIIFNRSSILVQKYGQTIDRESAYEILSKKVAEE